MDEDRMTRHIEKCRRDMEAKQSAFEAKYDLAQYPVYWGDEDSIVLRLRQDHSEKFMFPVTFIGRHSQDDYFTWSWADERLPDHARERSARIKQLSSVTGFEQFETPVIEMSPPNLERVIPLVLEHLNAVACFVDKSKEPFLFLAITGTGTKKNSSIDSAAPAIEEVEMSEPSVFMEEVLDVLKNSREEKLEGLFHGINLPPNWFEMVAPEFTGLFGMELKGAIIDISELEDYQLDSLRMAPRNVQDNVKQAIKLDYVIPDSDQNESGSLTFPICLFDKGYKILLVGG